MEALTNYVKPELFIVSILLYFIGSWLGPIQSIKDKFIPFILMIIGIILCSIWVLASYPLTSIPNIAMAIFTALAQGILAAGLSTYVKQWIDKKKT